MISVDEISRIREKRTRFRKELYTKIYEQVSRKIRNTVDVGGNVDRSASLKHQLIGGAYDVFDNKTIARSEVIGDEEAAGRRDR